METNYNLSEYEKKLEFVKQHVPIYSPERTERILELLTDNEKKNGIPTTDGLRRIAQYFYGPLNMEVFAHFANPEGVFVTVTIHGQIDDRGYYYSGSASCTYNNTPSPYNKHLLAIAETKAEGRALKKMLGVNLLIFEESEDVQKEEPSFVLDLDGEESDKKITNTQIQFIELAAQKLKMTPDELVEKCGYKPMNELSYSEATTLTTMLTEVLKNPEKLAT